ncbi:hypothetical protein AVEN_180019-1 [Araneus ventricosus]|uniref:Uncharacterized protein n=1 Tax=Araneus ventricosus TaxID=182803 RepID=A0A4Y2GXX5_ARAVE|nr:hypothetical protein AVEN_180019-1 [Araneus ventricosus]
MQSNKKVRENNASFTNIPKTRITGCKKNSAFTNEQHNHFTNKNSNSTLSTARCLSTYQLSLRTKLQIDSKDDQTHSHSKEIIIHRDTCGFLYLLREDVTSHIIIENILYIFEPNTDRKKLYYFQYHGFHSPGTP